jgi:putative Mg2+ transporter-C (MgtC) family protein
MGKITIWEVREMPSNLEIIFRLVLASILGGLIGLEREVHGREAGVRTYLLVSLGSALIMVVSEYLFFKYEGRIPGEFFRVDPGRIAAQAITGMGFLGAGVILRYKDTIRGLTTAACMWVVCAVGLAIGSGYYLFGSTVSGITILSLIGLKVFERKLSKDWYQEMVIVSADEEGQANQIQEIFDKYKFRVVSFGLKRDLEKKEMTITYRLRLRAVQPDRNMLNEVFEMKGIKCVEIK